MDNSELARNTVYTARSPLGIIIRTTKDYWKILSNIKHPELKGKLKDALETISNPFAIYKSPTHRQIFFYYRKANHLWIVVVARHLNHGGFIITSYPTKKYKPKGRRIWQKNK